MNESGLDKKATLHEEQKTASSEVLTSTAEVHKGRKFNQNVSFLKKKMIWILPLKYTWLHSTALNCTQMIITSQNTHLHLFALNCTQLHLFALICTQIILASL